MKRPSCSLCERTGASCAYPTTRKPGRRPRNDPSGKLPSPASEVHGPEEGLSTYSWETLFNIDHSPNALLNQPLQEPTQTQPTQMDQTLELSGSPTSCQTTAENVNIVNKTDSVTLQDGRMTLDSMFSIPAVEQAEQVFSEAFFTDVMIPIGEDPNFAGNTRSWFNDKGVGTQNSYPNYLNAPPNSTVGQGPNMARDFSPPSADDMEGSPSTLRQDLQPSAFSSLSLPETTADEL